MNTSQDSLIDSPKGKKLSELKSVIHKRTEEEWRIEGEKYALKVFQEAAVRIPAYKDFLKQHNIKPEIVTSYRELKKIPYTDKKNYIDKYSLKDLVWDGHLNTNQIVNTSSGTTGNPYFWPCSEKEIIQGAQFHEFLYSDFDIKNKSTLVVICFGMGTWIAGIYTFLSTYLIAKKYNLSIITPGFNKEETIRILESLGPQYEQVIIAGYPTFVKDVIDQWKKQRKQKMVIKFLFAAEGFTESWREYILNSVDSKNYYTDAINILGSADSALMGFETSLSIFIRRLTTKDISLNKLLFSEERVPSVENYVPTHRFFEEEKSELIITADRTLPLIRYNIHDYGGILSKSEISSRLATRGYHLDSETNNNMIQSHNLPYVYVFGRGKFTATIYAANVYPENVREVLADKEICDFVTGMFILETKYNKKQDHYLQLNIELAQGVKIDTKLISKISTKFKNKIQEINSEYKRVFEEYGDKVKPKVELYSYADPLLFSKDKLKKTA